MKQSRQEDTIFTHRPFAALKHRADAVPKERSRPVVPKPPVRHETEQDAEAVFRQAVQDVRPLNAGRVEKAPFRQAAPEDTQENRDAEMFLEAVKGIGAKIYDNRSVSAETPRLGRRSMPSRPRRLKKGSIRISSELDLHGCFREEALLRLERFIASCFAKGREAVLVITGKGNNSPEGPVIQTAVSDWLTNQGRAMVAEFHFAPPNMGGKGAFVVFLRTRE